MVPGAEELTRLRRRGTALVVLLFLSIVACAGPKGDPVDVRALLTDRPSEQATSGAGAASTSTTAAPATAEPRGGAGAEPDAASEPSVAGTVDTTIPEPSDDEPARSGPPIEIGIHYSKDLQQAYGALGARGAEGDPLPALRKLVEWINANGGMGGRQVRAIYHGSDPLNGSFDSLAQAACADFTEDHHALAVVSGAVLPTIGLADCLAKKRTPFVWDYHFLLDRTLWDQYRPYLYQPFSMTAERMGKVYVDELVRAGWFRGATVGVVRYDVPEHTRFSRDVLRPRLAAHRLKVTEEVAVSRPPTAAAAADTAAQLSNAIQRFCNSLFFLKAALDRAGQLTPAGLQAAVGQLGSVWKPVFTFSTNFVPGRHDGASAIRLVAHDAGCDCFKYTGPLRPAP